MSFRRYSKTVSEGDTVIICRGLSQIQAVQASRGGVIQVQGGAIKTDDLLGKQYGSKVYTSNGKQWVLIVHPTSEWWTKALPHRTQILYSTDISVITLQLELRPGSVVCECGTGSGSLSHAIIRTIAPDGHLYTCDFHEQRVQIARSGAAKQRQKAVWLCNSGTYGNVHLMDTLIIKKLSFKREEFKSHGLSDLVTVECRDVCSDGFGVEGIANAVFLDIPQPWDAIEASKRALKAVGSRLCCFSPCIEQVQQTCIKLEEQGFCDVEVMECIHRPINVRHSVIKTANLGLKRPSPTSSVDMATTTGGSDDVSVTMDTVTEGTHSKAVTKETNDTMTVKKDSTGCQDDFTRKMNNSELSYAGSVTMTTAQPTTNITGHTGYLTFATLSPTH